MIGEVIEAFHAIFVERSYRVDKISVSIDKRNMKYLQLLYASSIPIVLIRRNVYLYTRREIKTKYKDHLISALRGKTVMTKHVVIVNGNTKLLKFCVNFNKIATE